MVAECVSFRSGDVALRNITINDFAELNSDKVEEVGGDALVTVDFDGMRKNMLANAAGLRKP